MLSAPERYRLYEYVANQPTSVTRDEAAQALDVSRALAAFHLNKLVKAGLLKASYRRLSARTGPGAGRTAKLYHRSRHEFEVTLPNRQHRLLAGLLAESVTRPADEVPGVEPAHEYGRLLGSMARKGVPARSTHKQLLACVEAILGEFGFEPYRASDTEVRLRNCPFDPWSRRFTGVVCVAGLGIVTGVIDGVHAQGLRVSRDMRPDACCPVVRISERTVKAGARSM